MVVATITYDASGGADTNSGSNSPASAYTDVTESETISGTAAATTMTFSGIVNLTNVADDGTDIIVISSASGDRHLYRIATFTDGKATCTALVVTPAIDVTFAAVAWGIGGKRQTLDNDTSNPDLEDAQAGWRYELEAGTYSIAQTNTLPAVGDTTNGPMEIVAASGASPTISWTGDYTAITLPDELQIRVVSIAFSNGTSTSASAKGISLAVGEAYIEIDGCSFIHAGIAINGVGALYGVVRGCDIESTHDDGVYLNARPTLLLLNNIIHGCGVSSLNGNGITIQGNSDLCGTVVMGNIVRDNEDRGIQIVDAYDRQHHTISHNIFHANGGDAILFTGTPLAGFRCSLFNNIFTENGGYAINEDAAAGGDMIIWNDHNAFRNNTSGEVNNLTKGSSSVTLTADPYTDEAGDDYTLNDTAGGGAACQDAGYGYNG